MGKCSHQVALLQYKVHHSHCSHSYQKALQVFTYPSPLVWLEERGSMQNQGEARNRKHPPWVLLQRDEQQQKQHWLSVERQKEHLTTWEPIIFSFCLSSMTIMRGPSQHVMWLLQPKSHSAASAAPDSIM